MFLIFCDWIDHTEIRTIIIRVFFLSGKQMEYETPFGVTSGYVPVSSKKRRERGDGIRVYSCRTCLRHHPGFPAVLPKDLK